MCPRLPMRKVLTVLETTHYTRIWLLPDESINSPSRYARVLKTSSRVQPTAIFPATQGEFDGAAGNGDAVCRRRAAPIRRLDASMSSLAKSGGEF